MSGLSYRVIEGIYPVHPDEPPWDPLHGARSIFAYGLLEHTIDARGAQHVIVSQDCMRLVQPPAYDAMLYDCMCFAWAGRVMVHGLKRLHARHCVG